MKMLYRQAELAEERSIILNAIGFASDPNILSQVQRDGGNSQIAGCSSLLLLFLLLSPPAK